MEQYQVKPYNRGIWVIVEAKTGREIILFNLKDQADEACRYLNENDGWPARQFHQHLATLDA